MELSVSADGLTDNDYVDTAMVQATLTNGVLTEVERQRNKVLNMANEISTKVEDMDVFVTKLKTTIEKTMKDTEIGRRLHEILTGGLRNIHLF